MKKEVRQPLFSNEGCTEDNEVDWDLSPKFDAYKDEQEEYQQGIEVKTKEGEMHQEEIEAKSGLHGDEDAPKGTSSTLSVRFRIRYLCSPLNSTKTSHTIAITI